MAEADADLAAVAAVVESLAALGCTPVLVGGMALVILGSRRVTADFDFVIANPTDRLARVVGVFYDRGFELVSRLSAGGEVKATIDNRQMAVVRLRLDAPSSAFFFRPAEGPRVDLLFDFPVMAADLHRRATRMKIGSHIFHIAAPADLLRLKRIARRDRSFAGDAQDIQFLEAHLAARKRRGRRSRKRV